MTFKIGLCRIDYASFRQRAVVILLVGGVLTFPLLMPQRLAVSAIAVSLHQLGRDRAYDRIRNSCRSWRIVCRQMVRLTPPMISIVAAILERLRYSPRIITPAVAATNGTGITVCEAAVDVTLPRAWCQPA
jgi:hypothetical protein